MANQPVHNPNDFKVVEFHNPETFTFTPEMGCMYDGRPIFGITGAPGINTGESLTLPYHVGIQLAKNLAKAVMVRQAPSVDPAGVPTGVPLWSVEKLDQLKNSYIKELYSRERPIAETETERLMREVAELTKLVRENMLPGGGTPAPAPVTPEAVTPVAVTEAVPAEPAAQTATPAEPVKTAPVYKDKAEVITELEVRGIPHDKRQSKANLEKLLSAPSVA